MARFLGGIFGNTAPSTANVPNISGVYDIKGQYYVKQEGGWGTPAGMEATGGTTNTYTDPTGDWKSHTFLSSGSFVVTTPPTGPTFDAEFVIQGGGGGSRFQGSSNRNAGSGGGGMLYGPAGTLPTNTYPVTIGAGGNEANGSNSSILALGPTGQIALGGGMGGANDPGPGCTGNPGGCGGGGWYTGPGAGGEGTQPDPGLPGITVKKGDGSPGNGSPEYGGGGGGTSGPAPGHGINNAPGFANVYRYGPGTPQTYGAGGEASDFPNTPRNDDGAANSGDGASGHAEGGSGIVVIRYRTS